MAWPFSKKRQISQPAPAKSNVDPLASAKRAFAAAQINRLTSSWGVTSTSIDWDLLQSLNILQARSRDLFTNNEYCRRFGQMCQNNVVGPNGFRLKVQVPDDRSQTPGALDELACKAIEDAFWDWARRGNCDVTGRLSFYDICKLYILGAAREGETLIKEVYGNQAGPYGYQLQMLDIDRLDINKNDRKASNGNAIKMGVEVNAYGRPINYHLRIAHPGDNPYYTYEGSMFEAVDAREVYHNFIFDRPEQTRGFPWVVAAMLRLNNIGGYEEAAIIAARVGAAKMGFFTTPDGDGTAVSDDQEEGTGTSANPNGQLIMEAEPGVFSVLPTGTSFEPFNPDYPHAMYDSFMKAALRGVASGIGVAYNNLANDLEGVNFSSMRSGLLEERDNWMALQNWMIESFLNDVFSTWLKFALLKGAIKLPNGSALPAAKYDKFNKATWKGRRWPWIDPKTDADANMVMINGNLRSREDVIDEQGDDIDVVFAQIAAEKKMMEQLDIVPPPPVNQGTPPKPANEKPAPATDKKGA